MCNSKFVQLFKNAANSKHLKASDMLIHCLFKAIKAKHEDKWQLAKFFVRQSFRGEKPRHISTFHQARNYLVRHTGKMVIKDSDGKISYTRRYRQTELSDLLTDSQIEIYDDLLLKLLQYDWSSQ